MDRRDLGVRVARDDCEGEFGLIPRRIPRFVNAGERIRPPSDGCIQWGWRRFLGPVSSGEPPLPVAPPLRTVRESFQLTRLKPILTPTEWTRTVLNGGGRVVPSTRHNGDRKD